MSDNHYQLVTKSAAYSWHQHSRPWKIRLEYRGTTKSGNPSEKFWEMYSEGDAHPVYINWGKLGSSGRTTPITKGFWDALDACQSKLEKGYTFALNSCPHQALPQRSTHNSHRRASEPHLPKPLGEVYRIAQEGDNYLALDWKGNLLLKLTKVGAVDLYQASHYVRDNSQGLRFDSAR